MKKWDEICERICKVLIRLTALVICACAVLWLFGQHLYLPPLSSEELCQRIGLTQANLSILKTGKAKAVRFETMDAICREMKCQPGDLFEYVEDDDPWKR